MFHDPRGLLFWPSKGCFFWPIHPYHCYHIPFYQSFGPQQRHRDFLRLAPKWLADSKKKSYAFGRETTLRLSRILKVARRLEASLSVSKPPMPTDDGDFFRNRAVSCCRDQREVLCGRSSLPCVRVFLILKHCSKGRFPAKKHIVNGRDTIDGRNPVNHLACINLVNL